MASAFRRDAPLLACAHPSDHRRSILTPQQLASILAADSGGRESEMQRERASEAPRRLEPPAESDDDLAHVNDAWPILPAHVKTQIVGIISGLPRERQCPKCRQGRTRVGHSHRKGDFQLRTMECVECGYEFPRLIPAADIARRTTPGKSRRNLRD